MKKLSGCLLICTLLLTPGVDARNQELVLGIDHAPPYSNTQTDVPQGLILAIMSLVAEDLGISYRPLPCPFSRCLKLAEQGKIDILGGLVKTPERELYLSFIQPAYMQLQSSYAFYTLQGKGYSLHRFEDLYGKRIGTTRGAAYFPRFNQSLALKRIQVNSEQQMIDMLLKGRVDVILGVESTLEHALSLLQHTKPGLSKQPYREVQTIYGYMAFSRYSPHIKIKDKIEQSLKKLASQGALNPILKKYQLPEF